MDLLGAGRRTHTFIGEIFAEWTTMRLTPKHDRGLDRREVFVRTAGSPDEMRPRDLRVIDEALLRFTARALVSSSEVVDLLLDVRSAVMFDSALTALLDELQER